MCSYIARTTHARVFVACLAFLSLRATTIAADGSLDGLVAPAMTRVPTVFESPSICTDVTIVGLTTSRAEEGGTGAQGWCGDSVCSGVETCGNCPQDCNQPISCASENAQCGYISRCNQSYYCGSCPSGQECDDNYCVNCEPAHCFDDSWCPSSCWCSGDTCVSVYSYDYCYWGCY
jgi:hypothetical protein